MADTVDWLYTAFSLIFLYFRGWKAKFCDLPGFLAAGGTHVTQIQPMAVRGRFWQRAISAGMAL